MTRIHLWIPILQFLIMLVHAKLREVWCPDEAFECSFTLVVDYGLTMMNGKDLVKSMDGKLYRFDVNDTINATTILTDDVITADGYFEPRLVMAYNNTMPGPALHVRKGQRVRLTVINNLMHETTTLHMHGQHQRGTPFSDGVPFVTQCPILPGQTFVHLFSAYPEGTYHYHAHSGPQMSNGLFGPFIVHPSLQDDNSRTTGCEEKSSCHNTVQEHILTLQDWNHDWDSNMVTMKMRYGLFSKGQKLNITHTLAGIAYSAFEYQSGLINGRGRFYDGRGRHNGAPLSEFTVTAGRKYRFRVINAADIQPFRLSVDSHVLEVVASDGHEIEPVVVESLIINPGERYDFLLSADQPVDNYWIRAHTLQSDLNNTAEAILRYEGAPVDEPVDRRKPCTESERCIVLNCPFMYFPKTMNTQCFNIDKIRSAQPNILMLPPGGTIVERFMNFAFPGSTETPGSVNGKAFVNNPFPPLSQPQMKPLTCSRADCGDDKVCHCPYTVEVKLGDLVQLVFVNMGSGKGWDHPIHLHGHSFQVVKVGFPIYNETTGKFIRENEDIDCGHKYCNRARWANAFWENGNIPGMNLFYGAWKDDVIVPSGGYVVVRFKADNPGLWAIHCHIGLHLTDGMMALIKEASDYWPTPPPGFPTCHSYLGQTSTPQRDPIIA